MIQLSTNVSEAAKLHNASGKENPNYGLLIGIKGAGHSADVFNVTFISDLVRVDELVERAVSVQGLLPGNVGVIGLAVFDETKQDSTSVDFMQRFGYGLSRRLNLDVSWMVLMNFDGLIADRINIGATAGDVLLFDSGSGRIDHDSVGKAIWKRQSDMQSKLVTVRVAASIPWSFNCQGSWTADDMEREIRRYYDLRLSNLFTNKSYSVGFRNGTQLVAMLSICEDAAMVIGPLDENSTVLQLFNQMSGSSKRKELFLHQDAIDGFLLEKTTQPQIRNATQENDRELKIVPVVQYEACDFVHFTIPLKFQLLVVCSQDLKLSELPSLLLEAFDRSISIHLKNFLEFSELKSKRLSLLEPYVFLPSHFGHFVTDYFPIGSTDAQLEAERRSLHSAFDRPLDRPLFRKANKFYFPHERGPYLINVHESVGEPGIDSTMVGTVFGNYQYRHYMQDNMDDKNWGCAYRSFQTIWSWFVLNGYTEKPVPTHREIQQALVDVGDKQPNFVSSRQWVGSLELSFCLSHLDDITSKILSVNSGDEMAQKARELIHHFRTQGTPVMIGGGVLAHTILGVAYNEDNGDAKFLVLDPHYTGDENLKTIIDKGWCGWKPVSFWDKNAFYNMMLPLRPNVY